MKVLNTRFAPLFVVCLVVLSLAVVGCSKESADDTQATSSTPQTTAGRAVEKAKDAAAALSNPKVGIDPVCGMAIDESAIIVTLANGQEYGFCSVNCSETFKADPSKYDEHAGHNH